MVSGIWIYDKHDNSCRRFGIDTHDMLVLLEEGIHYYNLQNGDGGWLETEEIKSKFGDYINEFGYRIMSRQELNTINERLSSKNMGLNDDYDEPYRVQLVEAIYDLGTDKESYRFTKNYKQLKEENDKHLKEIVEKYIRGNK